jgi:hypothetical protein
MRKLVARTTPLEMRVITAFRTPMAQLATPVIHRRVAPIPVAAGSCTGTPERGVAAKTACTPRDMPRDMPRRHAAGQHPDTVHEPRDRSTAFAMLVQSGDAID